jgi:nucleoside-diphosphate-sugar epimerase
MDPTVLDDRINRFIPHKNKKAPLTSIERRPSTMVISSMHTRFSIALSVAFCLIQDIQGFVPGVSQHSIIRSISSTPSILHQQQHHSKVRLFLANTDENSPPGEEENSEAEGLRRKAAELREQIRNMEEKLGDKRPRSYQVESVQPVKEEEQGMTLKRKRVLVVGANGRLGSMVCRNMLRNHPETEVVAAVHYVGENSSTSRGYGRLSYEVGAEDGIGNIGPAWSPDDRTATFEFADYMKEYNLKNLRIVECELLDPVQCMSIAEGCDAVVWCATDFDGNTPRALGLNVAFLFRAIAAPDKGRVEVEGLQNMLGALKTARQEKYRTGAGAVNDPVNFVLVSTAPDAFQDSETPFGSFKSIKKQGENMLTQDFPSLTHTVLRMSRFDDSFVEENLDVFMEEPEGIQEVEDKERAKRRINRRDAARAVVQALTSEGAAGKTVEVWTATR